MRLAQPSLGINAREVVDCPPSEKRARAPTSAIQDYSNVMAVRNYA